MQLTNAKLANFCAAVMVAAGLGCDRRPIDALGTLEWDQVHGRAVASQPIVEIFAREGDVVKEDQPILRLDTRLQEAEVARFKSNVQKADWQLKQMEKGYRTEEVASVVAEAEAAKETTKTRQMEYERERSLYKQNASSLRRLDITGNMLAQAKANERSIDERRKMMESGYRVEEIEQSKAELSAAKAELQHAEEQLERYTVTAERPGVLDSLPFKLGDKPPLGAVVSTVLSGPQPWARVYLPQPWLSQVKQGDVVDIYVDGRTAPYQGSVRHISSNASFTPYYTLSEEDRSRLSYVTEIDLIGEDATQLPLGIPVRMRLREQSQ